MRIRASSLLALALAVGFPAPSLAKAPGTLAVIGVDHQVYLQDPAGGEPRSLTGGVDPGRMAHRPTPLLRVQSTPGGESMRFSNPAWSPDGAWLLAHGTRVTGEIAGTSGVYRLDPKRPGVVTPLHEDPRRGPIYSFWDPTGRRAGVLLDDPEGVSLGVVDVHAGGWRAIGTGLPFYFAWSADGERLLAHVGGSARENPAAEVRLVDVGARKAEGFESRRVSARPAAFRAPAWEPGGRYVYAAWPEGSEGGPRLQLVEAGGETRDLGPVASRSAFSWTADGRALLLGEGVLPTGALYAGVALVDPGDGRREPLYAGAVGGFFGSPDGKRVLVIAPDLDTGEWRSIVVSRSTREAREVLRFLPSPEAQQWMLHFDQYAISHRVWSPDSQHFVVAGYPVDAGRDGPARPTVWVVDAGSGAVRDVAEGRSAVWSPR